MAVEISELDDLSRIHLTAAEAVAYAISSLEAALSVSRYQIKHNTRPYLEMRKNMPYIIHSTEIDGASILVNRNYKPVGSNQPWGSPFARYEDFPNLHVRLSPEQIASVVCAEYKFGLFGDASSPWRGRREANAYLGRLQKLLAILVRQ